jgi:hypothetical protein
MPEERIRLYTAAMQDQQLFNALADEQALKELLADPQVRDRLLQAVRKPGTSKAGDSLSWWGWLRRPAGLAFAGGLAAILFAVAFATKTYQESLKQATDTVATDNAPAPSALLEPRAEPREALQQAGKRPKPPAAAPASKALQAPVGTPDLGTVAPSVSARALFYGIDPGSDSAAESGSQAARPEGKTDRVTTAGNTKRGAASLRPLGLRYNFVIRDTNGQEKIVDAKAAARSVGPVRISMESSQDAYLQILQTLGTAGTRLWWPPQETGKISLKVLAGKRNDIPLPPPAENGLLSLIVRLSPKPFAPLTMQEVGMLDRFAANLLIESVAADETGAPDLATYVVSQDSSPTAQMTVEIPIRR